MLNSKMLKQFNKAYANDALKTAVYGAGPIGLVIMLYEGAIKAINQAVFSIEAKDFATKARMISNTIDILDGLRDSLDLETGSEAAHNLNALYVYMRQRLCTANLKNDLTILHEVRGLLETILPAWQQVNRSSMANSTATASNAF